MILENAYLQSVEGRLGAIRSMPAPIPKKDRKTENIKKISKDSFVALKGKVYKTLSKARWGEGDDASTEFALYCLNDGSTPFLEWWDDLGLKASLSTTRLTWKELGVSKEDVAEKESLYYHGKIFEYVDDYEVKYTKPDKKKEPVYVYLFRTRDEKHSISLQIWGEVDGALDAWLSESLDPAEVEVLALV